MSKQGGSWIKMQRYRWTVKLVLLYNDLEVVVEEQDILIGGQ